MAERRRNRKKKEQTEASEDSGKPSKEEYAIAKYMRQKLPEKKTMLLGHKVDYFIAARAIDCLLDSPWATKLEKQEAIFTNRESCIEMMDKMLQHKFFHRAKKIVVQKDLKKKKKEKDEETAAESGKEKEQKEKKEKKKKEKDEETAAESGKEKEQKEKKEKKKETKAKEEVEKKKENKAKEEVEKKKETKAKEEVEKKKETKAKEEVEEKTEEKKEGEKEEKKKEKRKIKLDMHMEQVFIDGNEAYVWIYDPIPMRTWVIGMLMVAGAVLVCLFPLWPQSIRHYIYYLSVAAAFFLVFIIGLAIVRLVIFVLIWAITLGNHHLWLLPNLTEDVGFFESFWPLYHYEYRGTKQKKKDSKKEKEGKAKETEDDKSSSKETKEKSEDKSDSDQEKKNSEDQIPSESEQESDDTERDKTEKADTDTEKEKNENGDNGFEILDPEDEVTAHNNNNN